MRILLTLVLCCTGISAFAAPLVVRSGDHNDFTRVVIETRGISDWSVSQTGRRIQIAPNGNVDGYDLNQIFDRITRDRVANASIDGNTLVLDLACDCAVTSTELQSNLAVFDISDGQVVQDQALPTPRQPAEDWANSIDSLPGVFGLRQEQSIEAETIKRPTQKRIPIANSEGDVSAKDLPDIITEPASQSDTVDIIPVPPPAFDLENRLASTTAPSNSLQLNALEQRLARQIGTAATRGILAPALTTRDQPSNFPAEKDAANTETTELQNMLVPPNNLAFRNAARSDALGATTSMRLGSYNCEDSPEFNVLEWGRDQNFQEAVSQHRNKLFGEFDQLNKDVQIALAKTYAYFGFGEEAISILELDQIETQEANAVKSISEILAGRTTSLSLWGAENCDSDIAMWSVLSGSGEPNIGALDSGIILQTLSKLPMHLRQKLAPRLSEMFRGSGNLQAAELAIRTLERNAASLASDAEFESAQTNISSGDKNNAVSDLQRLVVQNTPESPFALAKFIDLSIRNNTELSEDLVLLAAAYDRELGYGENGHVFRRAYILALSKTGKTELAIELLNDVSDEEKGSLTDTVYRLLTEEADDINFLSFSIPTDEGTISELSSETNMKIGHRLLQIGFPEKALSFLKSSKGHRNVEKVSALEAAAYMQLNDFDEALDIASITKNSEMNNVLEEAKRRKKSQEVAESILQIPALNQSDIEPSGSTEILTPNTVDDTSSLRGTPQQEKNDPSDSDLNLSYFSDILAETETLNSELSQLMENTALEVGDP